QVIPDWRRFERGHPKRAPGTRAFRVARQKSSQIGVDFSDQAVIGVGFGQPGAISGTQPSTKY
ncbi:MAG TPA: hypothetical protein VLA83_09825, partial [Candidatus Binatia bacterium]|nr:hypothetical protein [Candidatus Binatia bacterium]